MKGWRLIYIGMAAMVAIALVAQFAGSNDSGGSGIALAASQDIADAEATEASAAEVPAPADDGLSRTSIFLGVALFVLLLAPVGLLSMLGSSRPLARPGSTDRLLNDRYSPEWLPAAR